MQYYGELHPRKVDDALNSITPELAVFRKEKGEMTLYALMTIMINDLLDFFSTGKTMGERQMVTTIRMIVDDFYYFNIEDFKLCFDNAKRGKYGKIYDRVDGNIIFEWLKKYSEERVQTAYPEGSYRPNIADKNERFIGKNDEEFEKFRISYIVEKMKRK